MKWQRTPLILAFGLFATATSADEPVSFIDAHAQMAQALEDQADLTPPAPSLDPRSLTLAAPVQQQQTGQVGPQGKALGATHRASAAALALARNQERARARAADATDAADAANNAAHDARAAAQSAAGQAVSQAAHAAHGKGH